MQHATWLGAGQQFHPAVHMGLVVPQGFEAYRSSELDRRASIENPSVPISARNILAIFGVDDTSSSGERVTVETALGVPSVWAAVNFLSGTLAGLPLHVYRRTKNGRERAGGALDLLLHDAVNDELSSFDWRKHFFECVFTQGRGLTFIERSPSGRPINLWPLNPDDVTVRRKAGRTTYELNEGGNKKTYQASEIIDVPFMLAADRLQHRSPITTNRDVIGKAIAMTRYGSKFFQNGGVPPFAIEGPFQTPGGMQRAADDLAAAVAKAGRESRMALSLPAGHTIKPLGVDPDKSQMTEAQRFAIEEVSRIYSLPPTFLQDLTHGTHSNTEQQALQFVKHTLRHWITQFEQQINLKLFGRASNRQYAEMNVDGLLRGDFKTRMDGYARAIQSAIMMPNEARQRENMPDHPDGNVLLVQGAMVPIGRQTQPQQGDLFAGTPSALDDNDPSDNADDKQTDKQ